MDLTSLLDPGTRVIDVGATDPGLAARLSEGGRARYLGLVPPRRLPAVRDLAGDLAHRFHELSSIDLAMTNSTDVVVLRGPYAPLLWSARALTHVRHVVIEHQSGLAGLEARLAGLVAGATGKLRRRGPHRCGPERFDVYDVVGPPARRGPAARHHLSPVWGVTTFVERLDDLGVRYAALRWFERLPLLDAGEDLDLLVHDGDLAKVQGLLAEEPGTIPVDLYSETGLDGSDYKGIAYYPPARAAQLLERAVVHESGCRVPAPEDHLHSLAYHALYHKGERSGLPSTSCATTAAPEHDYAEALRSLADAVGVDLPATMEGIDEHLAARGWRPPPDTIRRLAASNDWLRRRHCADDQRGPAALPEPTVFLVREETWQVVGRDELLATLGHFGFEVLVAADLDADARQRCAIEMRGGNWGRGPFPVSGGTPVTAVVALHHAPRPPKAHQRAQYPRLSNLDVLDAKLHLRELVGERVGAGHAFNPIHSSDDEQEAWEYLELALPEHEAEVRGEVHGRRVAYQADTAVLRTLSRGRRAKVELVEGPAGPVVRKTFAAGFRRHFEREVEGLRTLAPLDPAVPRLLEVGPNWFTMPYYGNEIGELGDVGRRGPLLPLRLVRDMVEVLRRLHGLGYDVIDAKPHNFVLDPVQGLKILDFEFLHRYGDDRPPFVRSYGLVGVPADFTGDAPAGTLDYEVRWLPLTGLTPEQLVAPPWRQHLHRTAYRVHMATTGPQAPARRAVRSARRAVRAARRRAGTATNWWAGRRAAALGVDGR